MSGAERRQFGDTPIQMTQTVGASGYEHSYLSRFRILPQ